MTDIVVTVIAVLFLFVITKGSARNEFVAEQIPILDNVDTYFFTSIVKSFQSGSMQNAAFETGTPVIYQNFGFFVPALIAKVLSISSHLALWGLIQPFYSLLAILLGYDFSYSFFKDKISKNNYFFSLCAVGFPLLLAPLHPLYVMKLNINNFIFSGMGYLLPAGTVTFPICIILILLTMLMFYNINWNKKSDIYDKIFFSFLLGCTVIAKTFMGMIAIFFFASIILYRVSIKKEKIKLYLPYFILIALVGLFSYKLCMGYPSFHKTYLKYGYLTECFAEIYKRHSSGLWNQLLIIGLIIFTYLLWLGIRLLGLFGLTKFKDKTYYELVYAGVISLIFATIIAQILNVDIIDIRDNAIVSSTFNVQQAIRSSFYILTIISSIGILNLIFITKTKINVLLIKGVTFLWCFLAFICLFNKRTQKKEPVSWYYQNYSLLKSGKLNDGLIVVNPFAGNYGIMLSACDYGKYWTAMGTSLFNYNTASKNSYRWEIFGNLLDHPTDSLLDQMKKENVKYIIAIPDDIDKISHLPVSFPTKIKQMEGSNWVFQLL